jgi:hypothetical protein
MSTNSTPPGDLLARLLDIGEAVDTFVRHRHDAHIGVDGAEGIVLGRGFRLGDGVEEGGLAHVGQSDDSDFHDDSRDERWMGSPTGLIGVL